MIIILQFTKKRILTFVLMIMIFIGLFFVASVNSGENTFACDDEASCQAEIDSANAARDALQQQQAELAKKSNDARAQVENIIKQINLYTEQISTVQASIVALQIEQDATIKSMKETETTLRTRLVETQLSFETNEFLEFIANSNSITEMIERTQVIQTLSEADNDLILKFDAQEKKLQADKELAIVRNEELETLKKDQVALQVSKQAEIEAYNKEYRDAQDKIDVQLSEAEVAQEKKDALKQAREALAAQQAAAAAAQATGSSSSAGTASPPITAVSGDTSSNSQALYSFFQAAGYTPAGAAGIIGNFYAESNVIPTAVQGGGAGPGTGLAQWENANYGGSGRWNQLLSYATIEGLDPWALGTQAEFTVYELTRKYPSVDAVLRSSNDVSETTNTFLIKFEAPACPSCTLAARTTYAQYVMDNY